MFPPMVISFGALLLVHFSFAALFFVLGGQFFTLRVELRVRDS